ncbi:hypothetical protein ACFZAR_22420 [Streptomyces sp. NPDC008222]|uniref:hypothetical protein n=1 Tax=Streptomyces sp. NPDC008222 TaxID=3364820 RepID=UPI0036E19710
MSYGGRIRITTLVLGFLALIGLSLFSAFGDVHGQARTSLSVAIAALTSLVLLLNPPALRPPGDEAVARSAGVAFTGRLVILAVWLLRALISGFSGYFISSRLQGQPGFQGRVALLTVVGQLLVLVTQCGRSIAGFRPDWGFSRDVLSVARYLLNGAVLVCLAGYATTLPDLVETALTGPPSHVYRFCTGLGPAWLAAPLTVVACVVWFFGVLVVESVLQWLLAAALGRENSLGEWLGEHTPITYRRTDTSVTFDFDFWLIRFYYYNSYQGRAFLGRLLLDVKYSSDFPGYGDGPTARQRRTWEAHVRPLTDEERQSLSDRIVAAMMAQAPPEWDALTLEYRAVVGHQEVQLEVDPPAGRAGWYPSEAEDDDSGRAITQLPDFAERDALWRLREASYSVDHGVFYVLVMTVKKVDPAWRSRSDGRPWRFMSPVVDRERRPAWEEPPTARQYRRDLRRFPTARGRRPFWLRNKVKRIG